MRRQMRSGTVRELQLYIPSSKQTVICTPVCQQIPTDHCARVASIHAGVLLEFLPTFDSRLLAEIDRNLSLCNYLNGLQ